MRMRRGMGMGMRRGMMMKTLMKTTKTITIDEDRR